MISKNILILTEDDLRSGVTEPVNLLSFKVPTLDVYKATLIVYRNREGQNVELKNVIPDIVQVQ